MSISFGGAPKRKNAIVSRCILVAIVALSATDPATTQWTGISSNSHQVASASDANHSIESQSAAAQLSRPTSSENNVQIVTNGLSGQSASPFAGNSKQVS